MAAVPTSKTPHPHAHAKLAAGVSPSSSASPQPGVSGPVPEALDTRTDFARRRRENSENMVFPAQSAERQLALPVG